MASSPPSADPCAPLVPEISGPRLAAGDVLDLVRLRLWDHRMTQVLAVTEAVPPVEVPDHDFYVVDVDGRGRTPRWCYVHASGSFSPFDPAVQCDDEEGATTMPSRLFAHDNEARSPTTWAQLVALMDRPERVYLDLGRLGLCVPSVPKQVLEQAFSARVRSREDIIEPTLEIELIEELRPKGDLAQLVHVRAQVWRDSTTVHRTELWSWNPEAPQ